MAKNVHVNITASDLASKVFAGVKSSATSMASHINNTLDNSIKFEKSIRQYNNSMYRFNRVVSGVVRTAGDSIYNFTKDAINNFSELERQHAKTMGAMATDYAKTAEAQAKFLSDSEKLKRQAIQIGTYGVNGKGSLNSVSDVSYAQTALVKAGLSADNILNTNVVESILKFAGGNDLDVDTATTFAVNLGTVFDKPIDEWGKMLDMVTKAADISVIDVADIMDSLTYTGGIASGLGRDLEEVLGVISVMGQAGLRGRVAGTGLQSFFTRILAAGELTDADAGKAPTDYVAQIYDAFTSEAVNADGSFKDMDEVTSLLDTAMESLNDQEQAWFAKKLFGLYQMKAAYALTGAVDGDTNLITDFINQISNGSTGSNDMKYELMQASQYGKVTALRNAWEGIKTDFGDKLSPVVSTVADELLTFLANNGNYDINFDKLRDAINESGELIGQQYGEELGQAIANLGNLGLDAGMIAGAMTPYVGGIINGIALLLQGDISGALEAFSGGLKDTNEEIDDLPPELQGSAKAARNVITAFTTLAGVNIATQIVQIISSAFNTFIAKPISWVTGKISSGNTTVTSTNATMTVASINIGSVPLMNVNATVVNVYGGYNTPNSPNSPTTPTTPQLPSGGGGLPQLPSGGLPMLPSGGGGGSTIFWSLFPYIIGAGGAAALMKLFGGGAAGLLGSGGAAGMLGSGSAAGALGAGTAAGKTITMYKVGNTFMTAGQIAGAIASKASLAGIALASIPTFGSPGLLKSQDKRIQEGSDWLDKYVLEGNTDYSDIATNARVADYLRSKDSDAYYSGQGASMVQAEIAGRTAAREEMMLYYKTGAGAEYLSELFAAQIEENGKITEEFLSAITQWTKDGYTYSGSNDDVKEILEFMYSNFGSDYKDSWTWGGKFNDNAINKFLKDDPTLNVFESIEQIQDVVSSIDQIATNMSDIIDKIQSPVINVDVTTNVDKSGNATTNVDINSVSKSAARRASQYGQTAMIN